MSVVDVFCAETLCVRACVQVCVHLWKELILCMCKRQPAVKQVTHMSEVSWNTV
jgi:hypothetical protein